MTKSYSKENSAMANQLTEVHKQQTKRNKILNLNTPIK